jgi:polyphosphate glucokinase
MKRVLGIDVGGSGVKGAIVNVQTGHLLSPRYRVKTPRPATPRALAAAIARIVNHFHWKGRIGVGMPGPLKDGKLMLARNLDKSWSGIRAHVVYSKAVRLPVYVMNDADAAGLAEMKFGAGRKRGGTVVLVTLGTGIGSAVFVDGKLVPNTELGQIELRGKRAEERAAARVRTKRNLPWREYAKRLQEYFDMVEMILWPDLIVVGGGVSRKAKRFIPEIKIRASIVPAQLKNEAGIIGAALFASSPHGHTPHHRAPQR